MPIIQKTQSFLSSFEDVVLSAIPGKLTMAVRLLAEFNFDQKEVITIMRTRA